ncbi:AMP-binding protein [Sphingomonas sp. MMS24-JH45]
MLRSCWIGSATLSYTDLEAASIRLSHLLRDRGLAAGDRVAILMENRLDWYVRRCGRCAGRRCSSSPSTGT